MKRKQIENGSDPEKTHAQILVSQRRNPPWIKMTPFVSHLKGPNLQKK